MHRSYWGNRYWLDRAGTIPASVRMIGREDLGIRLKQLCQQADTIRPRFCKILEGFSGQLFDHISLSLSFFGGLFEFCVMGGEITDLLLADALNTFVRSCVIGSGIMTGMSALHACRPAHMMGVRRVVLLLLLVVHLKQLLLLAFSFEPFSLFLKHQF